MADGGRYRGARDPKGDYFDDIMGDNSAPSIFGTPDGGFAAYESIQKRVTPTGVSYQLHCRPPGCGRPRQVDVGWGELFVVAHAPETSVLPPDWEYSPQDQAPRPVMKCNCGAAMTLLITPEEAAREVEAALRGGLISEQQLAADPVVRQVQAIIAQRTGAPPPGVPMGYR